MMDAVSSFYANTIRFLSLLSTNLFVLTDFRSERNFRACCSRTYSHLRVLFDNYYQVACIFYVQPPEGFSTYDNENVGSVSEIPWTLFQTRRGMLCSPTSRSGRLTYIGTERGLRE